MAAIGKIRSWGPILVLIIGLALFAFIAEELVRSCNSGNQAEARRIATILGEKVDYQDFNKLVDEYKNVKLMSGQDENLTDDDYDQLWQSFVSNKLIANEANKLGLTVTDEELQAIFKSGQSQVLNQYAPAMFRNQQTGMFDYTAVQKFLSDYNKGNFNNPQLQEQAQRVYNYWLFVERNVREQTLAMKYQSLLSHCFTANDVEAKQAFDERNQEASIQLAAFPYTSVKESEAKVTDEDLNKKYNEMKETFRTFTEQRNVKMTYVQVLPSDVDMKNLRADMNKAIAALDSAADYSEIVRANASNVPYLGVPMLKTSYPRDIQQMLDSMSVGQTRGPIENAQDGTINVVRLLSKESLPDSIQFRIINVAGADVAKAHTTADSIYTAIQGGAKFGDLAKKYGQTGDSTWIASDGYLRDPQTGAIASSVGADQKAMIEAINHMAAGETRNITLSNGNVILQVVARKAMKDKYLAAVIKRDITFSKDTRTATYNKFSTFAAASKNGVEEMVAAAKKNGYTVEEVNHITTANHGVPMPNAIDPRTGRSMSIPSSREALKWIFSASEGDVSGLFECGTNRDIYVLLALTKVNEIGYLTLEDKDVKEMVKAEALRDKQAEVLLKKAAGVKSVAEAQKKGAIVADVDQITFAAPAVVGAVGNAQEPALSGAVAAIKAGQFSSHAVKGNAGIYLFKVKSKGNNAEKYDAKSYKAQLAQTYQRYSLYYMMRELWNNAGIQDNRYMFF